MLKTKTERKFKCAYIVSALQPNCTHNRLACNHYHALRLNYHAQLTNCACKDKTKLFSKFRFTFLWWFCAGISDNAHLYAKLINKCYTSASPY